MSQEMRSISDLKRVTALKGYASVDDWPWWAGLAIGIYVIAGMCAFVSVFYLIMAVVFLKWIIAAICLCSFVAAVAIALLMLKVTDICDEWANRRKLAAMLPKLKIEDCLKTATKYFSGIRSVEMAESDAEIARLSALANRHQRALELSESLLADSGITAGSAVSANLTNVRERYAESSAQLREAQVRHDETLTEINGRIKFQMQVIELALISDDLEASVLQLPPPTRMRVDDKVDLVTDAIAHASGQADDPVDAIESLTQGAINSGAIR